jgi:hypothetical protein
MKNPQMICDENVMKKCVKYYKIDLIFYIYNKIYKTSIFMLHIVASYNKLSSI